MFNRYNDNILLLLWSDQLDAALFVDFVASTVARLSFAGLMFESPFWQGAPGRVAAMQRIASAAPGSVYGLHALPITSLAEQRDAALAALGSAPLRYADGCEAFGDGPSAVAPMRAYCQSVFSGRPTLRAASADIQVHDLLNSFGTRDEGQGHPVIFYERRAAELAAGKLFAEHVADPPAITRRVRLDAGWVGPVIEDRDQPVRMSGLELVTLYERSLAAGVPFTFRINAASLVSGGNWIAALAALERIRRSIFSGDV